jgi:hypothetical protein
MGIALVSFLVGLPPDIRDGVLVPPTVILAEAL